jgi:hypothetical protein
MQGVVMVIGVLILLPLALNAVGGLERATQEMSKMTPPRRGYATVAAENPQSEPMRLDKDQWLILDTPELDRVFRVAKFFAVPAGVSEVHAIELLEITTPSEVERILAGETPVTFFDGLSVTEFQGRDEKYGTVTLAPSSSTGGTMFKRGDVLNI